MKIICRIICLVAAALSVLCSCEKDFESEIYAAFPLGKFPATKDDYVSAAMLCYLPFGTWYYNMGGGKGTAMGSNEGGAKHIFDTPTDLMAPIAITALGANWQKISRADWSDSYYSARDSRWINHMSKLSEVTRMTKIISLVENAPQNVLDDATRKQLLGEMHLCRGLDMYIVLHHYGPMPMILDPGKVEDQQALYALSRPDLETMAGWITEDFEYAGKNCPAASEVAEKGRYNKDYARFCLIRHCLNEGSYMNGYYSRAVQLCEDLMREGQYSLFISGTNPYLDQFASSNKFNCEVIMAIHCTSSAIGSNVAGNMNNISKYALPVDASHTPGVNPAFAPAMYGWNQYYNVAPKFYDTFDPGDLRREGIVTSYIATNGVERNPSTIGRTWDGYVLNKFRPEVPGEMQPMDIPLARYADVLLMYAEAVTRRDNAVRDNAVNAVNEVRGRAGLAGLSAVRTSSVDAFLNAILDERGWEFYFEGFRKIDLIRFNQYARRTFDVKGMVPTDQYAPVPNFAIEMAASHGVELTQTWSRDGWAEDLSATN